MPDFVTLGLTLIVIAWAVQLVEVYEGRPQIQTLFVALYSAGVLSLVVDGIRNGLTPPVILNLASLGLALVMFILLKRRHPRRR